MQFVGSEEDFEDDNEDETGAPSFVCLVVIENHSNSQVQMLPNLCFLPIPSDAFVDSVQPPLFAQCVVEEDGPNITQLSIGGCILPNSASVAAHTQLVFGSRSMPWNQAKSETLIAHDSLALLEPCTGMGVPGNAHNAFGPLNFVYQTFALVQYVLAHLPCPLRADQHPHLKEVPMLPLSYSHRWPCRFLTLRVFCHQLQPSTESAVAVQGGHGERHGGDRRVDRGADPGAGPRVRAVSHQGSRWAPRNQA
jgi:hypothetical protein